MFAWIDSAIQAPFPAPAIPPHAFAKPEERRTELNSRLLGQFESLIAGTARSKHTFRRYCEILERFFGCFPRKRKPHQFHVNDIERYKRERLAQGISPKTLVFEIGVIRSFFNWYRLEHVPDWPNPASTRRPKHIPCSRHLPRIPDL